MKDYPYNYTIIIPHKNIPSLLQRCIKSIPQRKDIQIIVVDDGSDDVEPLHAIEQEYRQVTNVYTSENKGAGHARNIGLQYACGKWILFADADDFFNEGFLSVLDKHIDSDCELVFFNICSADSSTLRTTYKRDTTMDLFEKKQDENILRYQARAVWGKMFLHELVERHGIRFDEVAASNDVMFSGMSGLYARKVLFDRQTIYCNTVRAGSISTTMTFENSMARIDVAMRYNTFLKQHQVPCRYWLNTFSPIGDLLRVFLRYYCFYLKTYVKIIPLKRIGRELLQSFSHIIIRIFYMEKDYVRRKQRIKTDRK